MGRRICVAGIGAVGATVAARLLAAGEEVVLHARGARLEELQRNGLRVDFPEGSLHREVMAGDRADFGIQDIVFIAAKSHDLPALLPAIMPMVGPGTTLVPLVNGMPYWYFQQEGGRFDGQAIRPVDPRGDLCRLVTAEQTVGCVVYLTATRQESGVISVPGRRRLIVGDVAAAARGRAQEVADVLSRAGFVSNAAQNIRHELWTKIALNLATNPLSVVSEATLVEQFTDQTLLPLINAVIQETLSVAAALGARSSMTLEQMLATGRQAGHYQTSMLQDYHAGRPLELDAIAFAVLALARQVGTCMPVTETIVGLCEHRARCRSPRTIVMQSA